MWMPPPAAIIHSSVWPCRDLDLDPSTFKNLISFICRPNYVINQSLVKFRPLVCKISCTERTQWRTQAINDGRTTRKHNPSTDTYRCRRHNNLINFGYYMHGYYMPNTRPILGGQTNAGKSLGIIPMSPKVSPMNCRCSYINTAVEATVRTMPDVVAT